MKQTSGGAASRPLLPRAIRILSVPIVLFWIGLTVLVNVIAPPLEVVGEEHASPMVPQDAPSMVAMKRMGANFGEFNSNSTVMIVIEGQQPLGEEAHRYYDDIVAQLGRDTDHVQHIQNFWGNRLTAAGSQSADGRAAYVMLNLSGEQGTTAANKSVDAVRAVVDRTPPPPGVKAYVTGPAALTDDLHVIGNASLARITLFTLAAIAVMLLFVYRSIMTTVVQLFLTAVGLQCSRGVVAVLAEDNRFGLTTFAGNILTMLAIAAATDYGIFLFGRYKEARAAGEDRETAYYTAFRAVSPIILGSGLTIAGSIYCLRAARLPYFSTMAEPVAIGILVVVLSAVTLGPAVLFLGSKVGLFEPKGVHRQRFWRRIGTAVVRWPGAVLVASLVVVLIGLLGLPGYITAYNDQYYLPADTPANLGYAAAERHFTQARMNPDIIMIEADHDMRNPADMLVLDKVARNLLAVDGIVLTQSITRPLGIPIQHSSIPFQTTITAQTTNQGIPFMRGQLADLRKTAEQMQVTIDLTEKMYGVMKELADNTHDIAEKNRGIAAVTDELRDHLANVDDFYRPIRSYFYWEPHCFDIPVCASTRSLFDSLDSIDSLAEGFDELSKDIDRTDDLVPRQLELLQPMIASMRTSRALTLANASTMEAMLDQMQAFNDTAVVMGQSFDTAKNGDLFYLPPEAFANPDFQVGLKLFLSPDGKSARIFVTHDSDPATPRGIALIPLERAAARQALEASSLSSAKIFIGGTAATYRDMHDGANYDLMIAVVAALTLIFAIMLILIRSLVAAVVIVGTAAISIAASFGLSVLIWQNLLGIQVHWVVPLIAVVVLLAVGSDYNLLLVSRFKDEIHAGLRTGMIRAMAGTGGVVTSAGLVFAATMAAMLGSSLTIVAQMGSTIGIGLLLDTLIVRALLMPSIAALLGRWFWWPAVVAPRGAHHRAG